VSNDIESGDLVVFLTSHQDHRVPPSVSRHQGTAPGQELPVIRLHPETGRLPGIPGERIAVHIRSSGNGKHTTIADHMLSSHRRYADWTIGRIRRNAVLVGPVTTALCDLILDQRPHPEQGFRSCLGILRLVRPFGVARLEAAATRAIEIGALTSGSVRSILDHKVDRHAAHQPAEGAPIIHPNIRGSRYYQ
jgi:transposase